jgi:Protein of unknown function (DUF1648)
VRWEKFYNSDQRVVSPSIEQEHFMSTSSKQMQVYSNARARSLVTLICLMVFSVTFVIYTSYYLPGKVATHFNVNSEPDGWMTRHVYVLLILILLISIPSVITVGISMLSRKFPHLINLPNRDYWLATPRLSESLDFLAAHSHRLGRLVIVLITGLHYVVLVANRAEPSALPQSWLMAILLGFVFVLAIWVLALYRRFPRP